jgi:hypothetical protein
MKTPSQLQSHLHRYGAVQLPKSLCRSGQLYTRMDIFLLVHLLANLKSFFSHGCSARSITPFEFGIVFVSFRTVDPSLPKLGFFLRPARVTVKTTNHEKEPTMCTHFGRQQRQLHPHASNECISMAHFIASRHLPRVASAVIHIYVYVIQYAISIDN